MSELWDCWGPTWLFILGEPTEADLDYLFEKEILAYVLPDHILAGEC